MIGWLKRTRAIIASFRDEEKNRDDTDESEQATESSSKDGPKGYQNQYFEGLNEYDFTYSLDPPQNDMMIEWTYVYDLDNLAFTIQSRIHLRLDNIPRGTDNEAWIEQLMYVDSLDELCRSPFASDKHYANVFPARPLSDQGIEDLKLFEAAGPDRIDPTAWMDAPEDRHLLMSQKLSMVIAEGLILGVFSKVSNAHRPSRKGYFEMLAKELLTAASPANSTFSFDEKEVEAWYSEDKKQPPPMQMLWFRGRLVVFANGLDRKDVFKSSVGMVVRRARELHLKDCTAILWSVDHVAVVVVSGDKVSCSDAIPVAAAIGRDDRKFKQGLRLIAAMRRRWPVLQQPSATRHLRARLGICRRRNRVERRPDVEGLRLEWLKRPAIGPYTLLSASDGEFVAQAHSSGKEEVHAPVKLSIQLPTCRSFGDSDSECYSYPGRNERITQKVYRRANFHNSFGCIRFQLVVVNPA